MHVSAGRRRRSVPTDEIKRGLQYLYDIYQMEISALVVNLPIAQDREMVEKLIAYHDELPDLIVLDQEDEDAVPPKSVADIQGDIEKRKTALPIIKQLIGEHAALEALRGELDKP